MLLYKEIEALILIIFLACVHFYFSKIVTKPKACHLVPRPQRDRPDRKESIIIISEEFCFISIAFIFLLLYDLLYYLINKQKIPPELENISPYILIFLVIFPIIYSICLKLNKNFSLLKWKKMRARLLRQRNIAKRDMIITGIFSILASLVIMGATLIFSLQILFRVNNQ